MSTLYRRNHSPFYWTSFTGPDGKRVQESTKQTSKAKAENVAQAMKDAVWKIATGHAADLAQVHKVVRSQAEKVTGKPLDSQTVEEHLTAWLKGKETTTKALSVVVYRRLVKGFLSHLGPRSQSPFASLTARDVQTYATDRLKAGMSPQSVRGEVTHLSSIFKLAHAQGQIEKNPAAAVDIPDGTPEERQPFTEGELRALMSEAKGTEWETMIYLGLYTAARLGDCAKMKWEHVDLVGGGLKWTPEKTDRKRKKQAVPLALPLASHLETLAGTDKAQESPFLCPHLATLAKATISEHFSNLIRRAGVDAAQVTRANGKKFVTKSFHSLRHTNATLLHVQGVASEVRQKISGHASAKVHAGYTHTQAGQLREALTHLPDLGKPV